MGTRIGQRTARLTLLVALLASALAPTAASAAERNFTPRFTASVPGRLALAANTVLSCDPLLEADCDDVRSGVGAAASTKDNGDLDMVFVDVDSDPSTFSSSSARLEIPPGADVLFAGLYWGGSTRNGTPPPDPQDMDEVMLGAPGNPFPSPVVAHRLDTANDGMPVESYQAFADVTPQVRAAGAGTYTVADVQVSTGGSLNNTGNWGGWALVVALENPADPPRNLTLFDGYRDIGTGDPPLDIPLSGFLTPATAPVGADVALVAYDGELRITGDDARLDGTRLADAANPATNVFNSTIADHGAPFSGRTPDYGNQLGFDADLIDATDLLDPGDQSATLTIDTSGDAYALGVAGVQIDVFAPAVRLAKSALDVNGGALEAGDVIEYRIEATNGGRDGANRFVLEDPIPAGTSYVPGSLSVVSGLGASGGVKTDAADADTAEHDAGSGRVRFRLGTGASAVQGGLVAATPPAQQPQVGEVRFRVRVDDAVAGGETIDNVARASYASQTLNQPLAEESPPGGAADLTVAPDRPLDSPALPTVAPPSSVAAARAATPHAEVIEIGRPRLGRSRRGRPLLDTGLALRCPAGLPRSCGGSGRLRATVESSLAARRRTYVVAKLGFAARSGETRAIRIRLTRRGLRILRRTRRLRASIGLTTRGAGGARVTTPRGVVLRVPRAAGTLR